jgi:hypothetical protein
MVLHRPVELAALTGQLDSGRSVQRFKPRGYSEMEVRNGCRDLPGAASLRVLAKSAGFAFTLPVTWQNDAPHLSYLRYWNGYEISKSFTIETKISNYVDETKGEQYASDRVNDLLRRAMIQEQYERLEPEAAEFFAGAHSDRAEAKEFEKASLQSLAGTDAHSFRLVVSPGRPPKK